MKNYIDQHESGVSNFIVGHTIIMGVKCILCAMFNSYLDLQLHYKVDGVLSGSCS
jgi:hypothetical protein